MTDELHDRAGSVFVQVRALPGPDRSRRLEELCGADTALRTEVESLLEFDGGEVPFDNPVPVSHFAQALGPDSNGHAQAPARIGKYRITGVLGEGGMGVVYRAEQEQPRRVVALKVMRGVMRRAALLRRFEREAEALARLQHPGIAQVYEIGQAETATGPVPYLAMELIEGRPVTEFVAHSRLDSRARIALLAQVADAVHHAHTKGVIHRDLKPANILVQEATGTSSNTSLASSHLAFAPKVLDFGVARLTDERADATAFTDPGQLVGTIRYMSPEQLGGDAHAADVRSDVYALGLVGYELFCGRLPYELDGKALADVTRIIREAEPVPLGRHDRALAGDPEVILAKALEKDPARRYASAAELADDLRRFLTDQPITARPASAVYQLRKFARRNRGLVAAACVGVVALMTVAVVSTVAAVTTARARDAAAADAEKATRAMEFIRRVLSAAQPDKEGIDVRVVDVLDRAAGEIESSFAGKPMAEAYTRQTIGGTYLALGRWNEAVEHLSKAGDLRAANIGEDHPDTIYSRLALADAFKSSRRTAEARTLVQGMLDGRLAAVGEDDDIVRNLLNLMSQLCLLEGNDDGAVREGERSVAIARRIGSQGEALAAPMVNLSLALSRKNRFAESERMSRDAIAILVESNGPMHSLTISARSNLALVLRQLGRTQEAHDELVTLVEIDRKRRGPDHNETLSTESNLATVCIDLERYEEAAQLLEHCRDVSTRSLGADNPRTLQFTNNLGSAYIFLKRLTEAEALYRGVVEMQSSTIGVRHQSTLISMNNLARAIHKQGRLEEARDLYASIIASAKATLPPANPLAMAVQIGLGQVTADLTQFEEAEALLKEALAANEKLGPKHPYVVKTREALVGMYEAWGKPELAEQYRPAPE